MNPNIPQIIAAAPVLRESIYCSGGSGLGGEVFLVAGPVT